MSNFDKKYNSKEVEKRIREFWEKERVFKFNKNTKKKVYSIDTPPPTVSGRMHIGHAFSYTQTDFVARYKRMKGFEVFYPFGTDDNGLATEKLVQKEKKVDLRKVSRKEAVKIVLDFLEKERPQFIQDWKDIGVSCDFDISYSSIDTHSQIISQKSFLELSKKGLTYRKKGPIPWDRKFQTTIAQAELEDKEVKSKMNYIKAKLLGSKNTYIIYATTRPEMIFACHGFSVEDKGEYVKLKVGEEYWIFGSKTYEEKLGEFDFSVIEKLEGQDLIGEKVVIPLIDREIEITHDVSIKADLGTGCAYFCSYGGIEDIEYVKRHDTKIYDIINLDGTLNNLCGEFEGQIASVEGRVKVIQKLKEIGVLIKSENIVHIVNVGERSGVEVEYISSTQWFIKYLDKKEYFFEMAQKFNWAPEFMKHRIENWIKGLNWDWGFARQRHFGIPIPVWYCSKCREVAYAKESQLPVDPTLESPIGSCKKCGSNEFIGESDVFDTWFTSASSPDLSTQLLKDEPIYKKLFPMNLRPQGHDIVNFWLFYTMAKNNLMYGKNPFLDVNITGWVLAPDGSKMSKSKGNTIVPQIVVSKFSNDALRFAAASTKLGQDLPYQEKEVQTGIKVVNKLYNANKFASMLLDDFKAKERKISIDKLTSIDKWILAKMQKVIEQSTKAFDLYDYQKAKALWVDFFMSDVADNYIEIVKERLWKKKEGYKAAQQTLYCVLNNSLRGLAPFVPFITEEIYHKFYVEFEEEKSIHRGNWPEQSKELVSEEIIYLGDKYVEVLGEVRRFKAEKQVSMKTEIEVLEISCENDLREFIEDSVLDLKAVTQSKEIKFKDLKDDKVRVVVELAKGESL